MITIGDKIFKNFIELKSELERFNNLYRIGLPEISDKEFNILYQKYVELTGQHIYSLDGKVEYIKLNGDKVKNLLPMTGINKITTIDEFIKWITKYGLFNKKLIITPKYDGVSCVLNNIEEDTLEEGHRIVTIKGKENEAYPINHHFSHINKNIGSHSPLFDNYFHVGELIMSNETFDLKYSHIYKNVRNMVAGKLNPLSESSEELRDINFIRYNIYDKSLTELNKIDILNYLNTHYNNQFKVPYVELTIFNTDTDKQLLEDHFYNLYKQWSRDFAIDGIIIDVNVSDIRKELGFDTKGNPKFTVAYKNEDTFGDRAAVKIRSLQFPIDKDGYFNPCITTDLANLDGAECGKNIYIDTIDFMRKNKISVGADIIIKRGGQIIPRVYKVSTNFEHKDEVFESYQSMIDADILPSKCPYCETPIMYDEKEVMMKCNYDECPEIFQKQIEFFFTQIKAKGIGEKLIRQFQSELYKYNKYHLDFISIILQTSEADFRKFESFGERKAEIVYSSIHKSLNNASLPLLMSATNLFSGLAETKISWVLDNFGITFNNIEKLRELTLDGIKNVKGYSDITASVFHCGITGFGLWYESIKELLECKEDISSAVGDISEELVGQKFCFTGFRNTELENKIIQKGGKIKNSFSLDITTLVVKDKSISTTKVQKAEKAGITIIDEQELKKSLFIHEDTQIIFSEESNKALF